MLPAGIADAAWAKDRSTLWNAAEIAEKRKDARVAREIEVSLPHELRPEDRLALVKGFAQDLADRVSVWPLTLRSTRRIRPPTSATTMRT